MKQFMLGAQAGYDGPHFSVLKELAVVRVSDMAAIKGRDIGGKGRKVSL